MCSFNKTHLSQTEKVETIIPSCPLLFPHQPRPRRPLRSPLPWKAQLPIETPSFPARFPDRVAGQVATAHSGVPTCPPRAGLILSDRPARTVCRPVSACIGGWFVRARELVSLARLDAVSSLEQAKRSGASVYRPRSGPRRCGFVPRAVGLLTLGSLATASRISPLPPSSLGRALEKIPPMPGEMGAGVVLVRPGSRGGESSRERTLPRKEGRRNTVGSPTAMPRLRHRLLPPHCALPFLARSPPCSPPFLSLSLATSRCSSTRLQSYSIYQGRRWNRRTIIEYLIASYKAASAAGEIKRIAPDSPFYCLLAACQNKTANPLLSPPSSLSSWVSFSFSLRA